jgi:YD repeat-containing protein
MTDSNSKKALILCALCVFVVICFFSSPTLAQQATTTRYTYDENGRLKSVILPTGEAAIYNYDAAGNITSIQRIAVNGLALQDFSPREGAIGDQVTLTGVGFGATIAENTVKFYNNITATIVSASPTQIIVTVPEGTATGIISLTTPNGTVTTALPFKIVGKLQVQPSFVEVEPTRSMQFTTRFTSFSGDQSVTWKVNDITGGNSTVGTITTGGLYTAPAFSDTQASLSVVVKAVSVAQPTVVGESQVTVKYKLIATSAAAVSVKKQGGSFESVQAGSISIQYGPSPRTAPAQASGISVQYGPSPRTAPAQNSAVSVTSGPVISSLSPASATRGTTVSLTITGSNLTGATALRFINSSGSVDSNITVSNISVNGDGTSLSADVTVSSSAATGRRVLVVVTANSRSQTADIDTNAFTVQ